MKYKGVCTWSVMPYSDVNGCALLPDASQDANASNNKIPGYSKIINSDQSAIKTMIYNKHAVMINVTMDNGFINAGPGFIWNSYSGSGALPHALIICGYDDSKHAYKVMNSVGTGWGDAGYSWIDYDYFVQVSSYYLFVMNY
jgi:C1A family cysteine protease